MYRLYKITILFVTCVLFAQNSLWSQDLIVSARGSGNFRTIKEALESLSDSAPVQRRILIRNGIYTEKIMLKKHNIILEGESRKGVIIKYPVAREEWRCFNPDDWGAATVNINANDITLKNLTIKNSFGFEWKQDRLADCPNNSSSAKIIGRTGHQMTVRTMDATRFIAINCYIISYAGDTMSPWNVQSGMFYFKDCTFEGGVDLFCPRGWSYAVNCKFIATRGNAAIWHDGSSDQDSKSVLVNCFFDGYQGFNLGRYHKDSQFYLLNCRFSENMADKAIYNVPAKNILKWGNRVYYHKCHRSKGDYSWFADNFALSGAKPGKISAAWVFGEKWNPVKN